MQLWHDEVLSRFSWFFPGSSEQLFLFASCLKELTDKDGFKISFPTLYGRDNASHYDDDEDWCDPSTFTSNVSRPFDITGTDGVTPVKTKNCRGWKKAKRTLGLGQWTAGTEPLC
jgi:hypothetical protein